MHSTPNHSSNWDNLTRGQQRLVSALWLCCFGSSGGIALLIFETAAAGATAATLGATSLLLLPQVGMALLRLVVGTLSGVLRPFFVVGLGCTFASGIGGVVAFVVCELLLGQTNWMSPSSRGALFVAVYSFAAALAVKVVVSAPEKPPS